MIEREDHDPETPIVLDGLVHEVDKLLGALVFAMADGAVMASYVRVGHAMDPPSLASRMRRLLVIAEEESAAAGTQDAPVVQLELGGRLLIVHQLAGYGVVFVFDGGLVLGMARLSADNIATQIRHELPRRPQKRPTLRSPPPDRGGAEPRIPGPPSLSGQADDRGRRLLAFLERHAPEPHIVKLRLALRSGLLPNLLDSTERLGVDALILMETAAADLLGLDVAELKERL